MVDVFSKRKRSEIMSKIRSRDSTPEKRVHELLLSLRYKFFYQRTDLPGQPDFVFPRRKKIIFVHGCFWHQHQGCSRCTSPNSNRRYWGPKLAGNVVRDRAIAQSLRRKGWRVLTVWECATKVTKLGALRKRIDRFLRPSR
ncbi:MAG: DNA mismatch endonuclease Vsr [Ignavibacteria bacterium]|nr:DNA mismatch endonuclease Vsr [Ignavibacteria bacterium]